jgi:hypothetical protein
VCFLQNLIFKTVITKFLILIPFFSIIYSLSAQSPKELVNKIEPRRMISHPTAGVLAKNQIAFYSSLEYDGNTYIELSSSFLKDFQFGIGYGINKLFGTNEAIFTNLPSIQAKYRVLDESLSLPALAIGFDTQGRGAYLVDAKRFEISSAGLFLAASKNYKSIIGLTSLHLTCGYSFDENLNSENRINMVFGLEQTLGRRFSINLELNPMLNDNSIYNRDKLLFNTSLRYSIENDVILEFKFEDIFKSLVSTSSIKRGFTFELFNSF